MPQLTDKPHTLYITHGGVLTLKALIRRFNPSHYQWVVVCDQATREYRFIPLSSKMFLDSGELLNLSDIVFSNHQHLFAFILSFIEKIDAIALDANLTEPAGALFSTIAHEMVVLSQCETAVFFSETEDCIHEALDYAHYQHSLKPPITLKQVWISNRAKLVSIGEVPFFQIPHPKFEPVPNGFHTLCLSKRDIALAIALTAKLTPVVHLWVVVFNHNSSYPYQLHAATTVVPHDDAGLSVTDVSRLMFASPATLLEFIFRYAEGIQEVLIDANLSSPTDGDFCELVHDILCLSKCEETLLITDTEGCVHSTEAYLNGFNPRYRPPLSLQRAKLCKPQNSGRETIFMTLDHSRSRRDELDSKGSCLIKVKPTSSRAIRPSFLSFNASRWSIFCCCSNAAVLKQLDDLPTEIIDLTSVRNTGATSGEVKKCNLQRDTHASGSIPHL